MTNGEHMEEDQQEAPVPFRPYPPVKARLEELAPKNLNYLLNCLVGQALGIGQEIIDRYRRKKK